MSVDTLRENFHINRISVKDLQDFLTAQTYRPEITDVKHKILALNHVSLQSVCSKPIRQGKSPKYTENTGLICIKPRNTNSMLVSAEEVDWIEPSTKAEIQNQKLVYGDVVITRSGSGTIGRASVYPYAEEAYVNDHLFIVRPSSADSHYVCSYLKSYFGERLLESGISGSTGQLNLSNEHIKAVPLFFPKPAAQKYIGEKVRQAERLRTWAKGLQLQIKQQFASLVKEKPVASKFYRTSIADLEPYRINPGHYDPVVLSLLKRASSEGVKLEPISALLGNRKIAGGATPKGADYLESGVLFGRVQNVKPLALDLSDAVFIDADTNDQLSRSECQVDDIVLSITGYPGTASLVTEQDLPMNINQHSVRFNVKQGVDSAYVCAALNSEFLKLQVQRLSIGGTRDALDFPSVGNLLIPRLSEDIESAVAVSARHYIKAVQLSKLLIFVAKTLVEELIEGNISEAELVFAQQALEAGDDSLDRALLERMTAEGIDGEGEPQFDDVDQLYDLLDQAKQALDADDTMAEA